MVRRAIWFLSVIAAVAVIAGCATVEAATRTATHPQAKVPSVTVAPIQSTACFVAGQSCSINPCTEPIIARPLIPQPRARLPTQTICEKYPNPGGRRLYVRR